MKKTKRKAFSFMRSYFDVLNQLDKDVDKLNFLLSIIDKQFLNEDPKDLNFIVNLCYESQRHSIESSVKGWVRVAKTDLKGNPMTNPPTIPRTNPMTNPKEEEEEEEVEVEEKVEVKEEEENKNYIECDFVKITDPMHILEFYAVQLNGTQKENNNKAWRPLVEPWFLEHLGEAFNDNLHVKNSFKKYYISKLGFTPKQTRQPTFNLSKI